MNLTEPIIRQAQMQRDTIALIEGERTITYGALADLVLRSAGHLAGLGVKPGDQVGICLKDSCQLVVSFLAVLRLGAVAVQMDWHSRPTEKTRIANAFTLKLILVMSGDDVAADCPKVPLDQQWDLEVAAAKPAAYMPQDWHTPAAVLGSSGTTGLPKFTLATHLQLFCRIAGYLELVPRTRHHRYLLTSPLYFSGGRHICLAALTRGDTLILYPSLFTAREYVQVVSCHKPTIAFIVPSVLRQLLTIAPGGDPLFSEMDLLICAGAPLLAEEKRQASQRLSRKFHEIYAATAIGPISALRPDDIVGRPTSVGRPLALVDIEVVDDHERPLGPGSVGRLRCRGPGLTSPFLGSSVGSSAEDFHAGWYYPGEIATIDQLGYIYVQGRTSEVIFRGGAKIFPAEVEAVLLEHEAVLEAAVVGRLSSGSEQELIAYVVPSRCVAPGELLAYCRTRLSAYKVPRDIRIRSELPRHSSGKVNRRVLASGSSGTS